MKAGLALAPILIVLFSMANGEPSQLRQRIENLSKEFGVPVWKVWDSWWQFQSCKFIWYPLKILKYASRILLFQQSI